MASPSIKLRVSALASSALAYTNMSFVNPGVSELLPPTRPAYVEFLSKNRIFIVDQHSEIKAGEIGLSAFQRDLCKADIGTEVEVRSWVPPKGTKLDILTLNVKIEMATTRKAMVEEDPFITTFKPKFLRHVLHQGQTVVMEYAGNTFKIIVDNLEIASDKEEKSGQKTALGMMAERGLLTDTTLVKVTPVPNKLLEFKGSKNAMRSNLLRSDWRFEDMGIGGLDKEFQNIFRRAFASRLFPPSIIKKMGIAHVKGMLLYGPPGTGKTLIARQIGKLLEGREPKVVNGPEVLNKYVGQSEENIRKLFEDAEKDYKDHGEESDLHIIIFDEIDAICKQRGSVNSGTGVHDTIVNQLLSKMDGVNSLNNILVIGMTNRKDMIDPALLRPGRMEVHVEIGLPDEKGRVQILNIHTKSMRTNNFLSDDVDILKLAESTRNFSGAEIEGLVRSAQSFAIYRNIEVGGKGVSAKTDMSQVKVTMADFMAALEEVRPAFGVSDEALEACVRGGVVDSGDAFRQVRDTLRNLVNQVKFSADTPLLSVLLVGAVGSGKTALAAKAAMESEFPFAKLITPEDYVGYVETAKVHKINEVFEDAYKSNLSVIVLDNVERLLEYVPMGPRFSNVVLQALLVLVKKIPPTPGRRLLILATSSTPRFLRDVELHRAFDVELKVAQLTLPDEIRTVIQSAQPDVDKNNAQAIADQCPVPMSVKQLLMLLEMAKNSPLGLTSQSFMTCVERVGDMREDRRDVVDY